MYWEWRNSDYKTLPEAGGLLDQNSLIMADLYAIGAWLDFVEYDIRHPEQTLIPAEAESAVSFRDLAG